MSYYKLIGNNVEHFYENVLLPIYGENAPITREGKPRGDWYWRDKEEVLMSYTKQFSDMTLTLINLGNSVSYYRNGECIEHFADQYVKKDTNIVFDIDKALKAVGFSFSNNHYCYLKEGNAVRIDFRISLNEQSSFPLPTTQLEFDCIMYFMGLTSKPDILNCVKLKDL